MLSPGRSRTSGAPHPGNAGLIVLGVFLGALCFITAALALDFPQLTGRVVDQAGVMTPESRTAVEAKLKDLEDKSGIQLVVATVKSLQGGDIETYANQLFRTWKLGEAQKNNGVLLLVAPAEHKVRIEVGYGLEGTLTDALSSVIISNVIVPRFKANDYSGGIDRGVDAIISVLKGDTTDWQPKVSVRPDNGSPVLPGIFFLAVILFIVYCFWRSGGGGGPGRYVNRGGRTVFIPMGGGGWSSGSSDWGGGGGGGFGGGFSGGGGSSGGGGASGSW
jgi:uncharacterized protein